MPVISKPVAAGSAASLVAFALYIRAQGTAASKNIGSQQLFVAKDGSKRERVAVNGVFFRRLLALLRIVMPGMFTPEAGFAAVVAAMMCARTFCDLWTLRVNTTIEAAIISRDHAGFARNLARFLLGSVPIACVNNLLKYALTELSLRFRTRLTNHLFKHYLRGFTYYKIANLDNRISNPDQLLTQDVERFCDSVTELFSNVSKPLLDMCIYCYKLSGSIGAQGPLLMLLYLAMSGVALTWLRRPTAHFTMNEQRLEGEFRFVNSRLITHSEEVAFYNGNKREEWVLRDTFGRLIRHARRSQQFRFSIGIVDSIVAKYVATVVGFLLVSRPFLDRSSPRMRDASHSELMQDYYRSGRMLLNLAMAMGRLVLAGREMTRLAGFTVRVTELIDVLKELNRGVYRRTMVSNGPIAVTAVDTVSEPAAEPASGDAAAPAAGDAAAASRPLQPGSGTIAYEDGVIKFDSVPLVTPNGDVLVPALSFTVCSGQNVLVCGPNGCGKSSLFRTLGELWPLFGGRMTKPQGTKLFYIPQKPYLTLGTLRDQVIYPDTVEDMRARGMTDSDLQQLLSEVHLEYLAQRSGGWSAVQDWADVLSGGEKQRVAMARVFYHKPQFAILDECTSAVSVDVEGFMYNKCRELGITLFTVSHRKSLWRYHEFALQFDGRGAYEFRAIDPEARDEFGS